MYQFNKAELEEQKISNYKPKHANAKLKILFKQFVWYFKTELPMMLALCICDAYFLTS